MDVLVRQFEAADIQRLRATQLTRSDLLHHVERWHMQEQGEAVHLLALRGERVVGHGTLFVRSKYVEVRDRFGDQPEVNALAAYPQSTGVGTALITAAERVASRRGASMLGLAVAPDNAGARRLYLRLGYVELSDVLLIDRWTERDELGSVTAEHADECTYMTKVLRASPTGA